jgi:hypothetical protein
MRENHPSRRQYAKERHKLARKKATRAGLPTALIVCEGKKTVPAYLRGMIEHLRLHPANAQIHEGSSDTDAVSIVKRARQLFEATPDFDYVCVVMDADQQNLERALQAAGKDLKRADGGKVPIQVILTNPCFEFWLLLHFTYTAKPYRNYTDVHRDLIAHLPTYAKGDRQIFDHVKHGLDAALTHVERLKQALTASNADCPDTDMPVLVQLLKGMCR